MDVDHPWHYDRRGRTADTNYADHIRDMVTLLVLTSPGERVNRPGFGCGLRELVFAPNSPDLAAALQFIMQATIQRELGDVLTIEDLRLVSVADALRVSVGYVMLATGTRVDMVTEQGMQP
ncbi:GPW/gp25 family protein [Actinoplanes sp. DH11]|uniref:GPW/gp25 family protein n=1 Tax=Actinoplanes sp. DH11 TaxID=2857011 RepID=UPI001E362538|nr:GPW/gp25 family protein [Actinoplanes sp. DH11]